MMITFGNVHFALHVTLQHVHIELESNNFQYMFVCYSVSLVGIYTCKSYVLVIDKQEYNQLQFP